MGHLAESVSKASDREAVAFGKIRWSDKEIEPRFRS